MARASIDPSAAPPRYTGLVSRRQKPSPRTSAAGASWLERLRELHADDPHPVPQILERMTGELQPCPIYGLAV